MKSDGGPAFPLFFPASKTREGKILRASDEHPGMTLRDYFAAQALIGMLSQPAGQANLNVYDDTNTAARWAYGFADALLSERYQLAHGAAKESA